MANQASTTTLQDRARIGNELKERLALNRSLEWEHYLMHVAAEDINTSYKKGDEDTLRTQLGKPRTARSFEIHLNRDIRKLEFKERQTMYKVSAFVMAVNIVIGMCLALNQNLKFKALEDKINCTASATCQSDGTDPYWWVFPLTMTLLTIALFPAIYSLKVQFLEEDLEFKKGLLYMVEGIVKKMDPSQPSSTNSSFARSSRDTILARQLFGNAQALAGSQSLNVVELLRDTLCLAQVLIET